MALSRKLLTQKLTQALPWISTPLVVGAPMRVFAGPDLAVAVSAAGGLGFIGPAPRTLDMQKDLEVARKVVQDQMQGMRGTGPSEKTSALPVGVGFQLWSDDLGTATTLVEQHQPCVAWLYAPCDEGSDFAEWTTALRQASSNTQIWIQIGTIREIHHLTKLSPPPDAIVVQGTEAGGHGRDKDGIGLITLLPEVVDLLKGSGLEVPVLAAGGIADGRGAAAALCLGAHGIVMGTRFLAATEARISRGYQQEIIRANDGATNTTRTLLYNHLRGTFGWPEAYAPRTIINQTFLDHIQGVPFSDLKKLHDEASALGDKGWGPQGRLATYAGASIGLIHGVKDAHAIVDETRQEIRKILGTLHIDESSD